MSTPNSVVVFNDNGGLVGNFSTIAAAVGASSIGYTIAVLDIYNGINGTAEMVTIDTPGLSFGIEAGGPKPTFLLEPGVVNIILGGDGDADVFDNASQDETTSEIMIGNNGNNSMDGWLGDDILVGGGGDDELLGYDGNDVLVGDAGNDQMQGEDGNDNMTGGAGNDNMLGGDGTDFILGGTGNDTIFGNDGTDVIEGGMGADNLSGGADADWLLYTNSASGVNIDLTADQFGVQSASGVNALSDAAGDQIQNFENVSASEFGDTLTGNQSVNFLLGNGGNDVIFGGGGDDIITGGDGADRVSGGSGADILFGDGGADTFVFQAGDTLGIVVDFAQGQDIIEIDVAGINNFNQLTIGPDAADIVIGYGADQIVLLGLAGTTLTAADFSF